MTRTLIENWRKWRHLDAESAVVQETPWESCPFWERHPVAFSWVILQAYIFATIFLIILVIYITEHVLHNQHKFCMCF